MGITPRPPVNAPAGGLGGPYPGPPVHEREFEITHIHGMHLRPVAKIVQIARSFSSAIEVHGNGQVADGKSIVSMMLACVPRGGRIRLRIEGHDARRCMDAMAALILDSFGEGRD